MKNICSYCKNEFEMSIDQEKRYRRNNKKRTFCSFKCKVNGYKGKGNPFYKKTHTKNTRKLISEKLTKGGYTISSGYLRNRLTKQMAHREVVEKYYNIKLKKNQIVHHINENRKDNRIENLQITTRAKHIIKHKSRSILKKCKVCKDIFITQPASKQFLCSIKCSDIYKKKKDKRYCLFCGKPFLAVPSDPKMFCSRICANRNRVYKQKVKV